ncbi:MAG: 5'-nucleotidase C-terminal domain-containing protein [Myxococcota bacterium]
MRPERAPGALRTYAALALFVVGCGPSVAPVPTPRPLDPVPSVGETAAPTRTVISVVGTNDVHGHVETLAAFGGYLRNLRARRQEDGGVVLVDGGDMWQGTIASNLREGAPVVAAYNVLGYDAATIGNHEFDYGPVGEATTPQNESDDRRGALIARAAEAEFAILGANFLDAASGEPVSWPGIQRAMLFERAGVKIGVIGVSTFETPATTIAANLDDVRMAPLAETIASLAASLRAEGATVVVVAAHAGAECGNLDDPNDLSSCNEDEIIEVARALPAGAVNVIVAGHTHKALAHNVNGVAVIESYALGRAFGRVDLVIENGEVLEQRIHPPRFVCGEGEGCPLGEYEGQPVALDERVAEVVRPAIEEADAQRGRSLEVTLTGPFYRNYRGESALGNLLADVMLETTRSHDLALLNAGGVRANLPAGPLTYGALYEAFPFDNRFATVELTGEALRQIVAFNLQHSSGSLIFAGLRVQATCVAGDEGQELRVELRDRRGRRIRDNQRLRVLTSDYLATTPLFSQLPEGAVQIDNGPPMRETIAERLSTRGGTLAPGNFYDAQRPRIAAPGPRPVSCGE